MVNVENLMMRREMFPSEMKDYNGKYFIIYGGQIPPLHRDVIKNGFPIYDVPALIEMVENAFKNSVLDIENLSEASKGYYESGLKRMKIVDRKLVYGLNGIKVTADFSHENEDWNHVHFIDETLNHDQEYVYSLPIGLDISLRKMTSLNFADDLDIDTNYGEQSFMIPKKVELTDDLMEEYEMELTGTFGDMRKVWCHTGLRPHNLTEWQEILFKNLVIEINNDAVRRKYMEI